ncbi:MAG TPA: serine hydrolase domain-containing protein [Clostridia bacterium]|nr:serine hydrolase domain-containing protein [Clostridia bacterium]
MEQILAAIDSWGASNATAAVVAADRVIVDRGDGSRPFAWASITKLVTALAALRSIEAGRLDLDEPAGPPGSTLRHLLAHASGLPFEGTEPISPPERTRIYSNTGFDLVGRILEERAGRPIADVLEAEVLGPLGMRRTALTGRPSAGMTGPLHDLVRLARELLEPALLRPATLRLATNVAIPGLAGVLPGVGRFDPLDWGLGFELRDGKAPHWTGTRNSPQTFGHFGGRGTFLWVDPDAGLALACLTDREYGPWALEAWPALSDAVLERFGAS